MVIYAVSIRVNSTVHQAWLDWMRTVHIPEVLRTGCFLHCQMQRVIDPAPTADQAAYSIRYACSSMEEYQRYRQEFATALQQDHTNRFGGQFTASREVLEEVASFDSPN